MALRTLAGKLRGLLPLRAAAPRPAAFGLEKKLAGLHTRAAQETAKIAMEQRRLYQEDARMILGGAVLGAATVGISVFAVKGSLEKLDEKFEELDKVIDKNIAVLRLARELEKDLDNSKGDDEAQAEAVRRIFRELVELGEADAVSSMLEEFEMEWEKEKDTSTAAQH